MSGQQQSPSRPAVRRHSSQVRFSRGDRSPIGTLTSEESSQGDSGTLRGRAQAPSHTRGHSDFNDINTYPVASETSHSGYTNPYYNSEADETELDTRSQRDSAQSSETIVAADHNRGGLRDSYTSTPPRIQTRRATNPTNMVPPSDKRQDISTPPATMRGNGPMNLPTGGRPSMATPPAPAPYVEEMLSPKSMPSEWGSPASQWQPQPPSPSPARPPSALKQTSASPIPTGPPIPGSTAGFMGQGFRQFDQPGPIYAPPPFPPSTPAASHEPIAPQQGTDPGSEPRFSLREWQEYQQRQQWAQNVGRHDSDETLTGGYPVNTEKPSVPRGSEAMHLEPVGPNEQTGMRRRTTREVEGNDEVHHVKGGVFSQLLRLAGRSNTLKNRNMSIGASSQGTSGELPIMENLGIRSRANSFTSTIFPMDELEPDDPRVTGKKPKPKDPNWDDLAYVQTTGVVRKRKGSIQLHVADILTRQQFILKLAKALMVFGAPSHRVESQLNATANVLEVDAQFIHLPSIVIASFGDPDTRTSDTQFIKASGGLDLGKLHRVHRIYRKVVHDELDAADGTKQIQELLRAPSIYNVWHRICLAFFSAGIAAPLAFGGSFVDGLAAGCCGILLSFWQLHVASNSSMYSNIFEISIATFVSFAARGLGTTGIFCYQAVASAGVTLILPGYVILCGSLELASKNIVSGSVRMVYAIIYSLFLGFGITIGSDIFFVLDRKARAAQNAAIAAQSNFVTLTGSFIPMAVNSSFAPMINASSPLIPFNGTFTFSNQSYSDVDSSLRSGHIICDRPDGLPWYRQNMPRIYAIGLVPIFSTLIALWNMQPIKSRQLPVMVVISCIGYLTNTLANHYIFDRSDVVSAIGAFVIGILGNIYSRVFGGTAFTSMVPGVLFLVPSGISAAGGLAMTNTAGSDSYSQGLTIGFRMVQVAIGITVGLFGSGLLIYSFGRKKGSALFAF